MTNREKVIKELEHEVERTKVADLEWLDCIEVSLLHDALKLLKAQEPVEPKKVNRYIDFDDEGHPYNPETYDCGACGKELPWEANYCPECGRKVKWNA